MIPTERVKVKVKLGIGVVVAVGLGVYLMPLAGPTVGVVLTKFGIGFSNV